MAIDSSRRNLIMKYPISPIASLSLILMAFQLGTSGCANPADEVAPAKVSAPKEVAPSPVTSAAPGSPASPGKASAPRDLPKGAEVLAINPETSKIEFVGSKVTGKHDGGFKSFDGWFALVPNKVEASQISAEISTDSVWTDTDRLTGHLKSPDFFDAAKYPKATFESTEITPGSTDAKAKNATHTVTGNLTLHGVTKSIQFPVNIAVSSEAAALSSEFFLNRKDFQINYPGMANDLIRDEVVIKLAIGAARKH
jgi:polyisoprenoid-binding protein YceI